MPGCIGPSSGMWPQRVLLLIEKMKEDHIAFKYGTSKKARRGNVSCMSKLFAGVRWEPYIRVASIERSGQGGLSPGHHSNSIQGEYWGL